MNDSLLSVGEDVHDERGEMGFLVPVLELERDERAVDDRPPAFVGIIKPDFVRPARPDRNRPVGRDGNLDARMVGKRDLDKALDLRMARPTPVAELLLVDRRNRSQIGREQENRVIPLLRKPPLKLSGQPPLDERDPPTVR
jgi:hypothetical protein